jgi:LacI family transcriptional regulator
VRNRHGSLSEENRRRLTQLVEMVAYVPSQAAQSLRGEQRNAVGVVLPLSGVSPIFYLEVLAGIKQKADFFGFRKIIFDVTTEKERDEFFSKMPFLDLVDGLIVVGLFIKDSQLRIMERHQLPVVVVHNRLSRPPVVANILTLDESALLNLIDRHLIKEHGYRRLALVTLNTANPLKMGESGREDWNREARVEAYYKALKNNDLPIIEDLIFEVKEHSFQEGYEAFKRIRQANETFSPEEQIQAVVCTSDTLAAAILTAAGQEKMQLVVTGYDNLPLAELLGITTVDQGAKNVGGLAFQYLFNALNYQGQEGTLPPLEEGEVGMKEVRRSSCGCPI